MARCISEDGKRCPFLKFNAKGTYQFHCGHNAEQLVQICEEDLSVDITCPLDKREE